MNAEKIALKIGKNTIYNNIKRYKHMFTMSFISEYIKNRVLNFEKQKPIFVS